MARQAGKTEEGWFMHSVHEGHVLPAHLNCTHEIQTTAESRMQAA